MFYPPEGVCQSSSALFTFYRLPHWGFQKHWRWQAFFKSWKCFIPRREAAKAAPKGSNWYSFHFIDVGNGSGGFKFTEDNSPFWILENVLSPEGTLESWAHCGLRIFDTFNLQTEIRLFEFLKMFYPPKGLCQAESEWGPFDVLSILLRLEKGVWHLQFTHGNSPFKILKMFYPPRDFAKQYPNGLHLSILLCLPREGCLTI